MSVSDDNRAATLFYEKASWPVGTTVQDPENPQRLGVMVKRTARLWVDRDAKPALVRWHGQIDAVAVPWELLKRPAMGAGIAMSAPLPDRIVGKIRDDAYSIVVSWRSDGEGVVECHRKTRAEAESAARSATRGGTRRTWVIPPLAERAGIEQSDTHPKTDNQESSA